MADIFGVLESSARQEYQDLAQIGKFNSFFSHCRIYTVVYGENSLVLIESTSKESYPHKSAAGNYVGICLKYAYL
jgi:hypothetical protein